MKIKIVKTGKVVDVDPITADQQVRDGDATYYQERKKPAVKAKPKGDSK